MPFRASTLLAALLLLVCSSLLHAQTAYAPGGMIVHPTAFTPRRGALNLYMAGFNQYEEDMNHQNNYVPLSLSYSPTDRLQLSLIAPYHDGADHPRHIHVGPFFKYQVLPDSSRHPAFAITGSYLERDWLKASAAGVFSHRFFAGNRPLLTAHAGVKWGMTNAAGNQNDIGGFMGLQIPVNREWNLVGEYSTRLKFDPAPASSVGVMWRSRQGLGITIGFANTGRSNRMGFFFGVGYALGGSR